MPATFATRLVKAGAEAAMVGGLADWFAVVALFGTLWACAFRTRPSFRKNRIATNLADFVRENSSTPGP